MLIRRLLSVAIALVSAGVGGPLLWAGGGGVLRGFLRLQIDPSSIGLAVLGILLLLLSIASVALSGLGAGITAIVHAVFGVIGLFAPTLAYSLGLGLGGSNPLSYGFPLFVGAGFSLLFAAVYGAAALASHGRSVGRGPSRAALGNALGIPLTVASALLAVTFGARVYEATAVRLYVDLIATVFFVVFVIAFGFAAALAIRWSIWGGVVSGALIAVVGAVAAVPQVGFRLPPSFGLQLIGPSMFLLALGLLVLVAGVAVRVRRPAIATIEAPPAVASM
ncbi:hypothetical protein BH11ACT3_BH11ACT3_10550 [soil metagenome]